MSGIVDEDVDVPAQFLCRLRENLVDLCAVRRIQMQVGALASHRADSLGCFFIVVKVRDRHVRAAARQRH
jgi:hypothetical protein